MRLTVCALGEKDSIIIAYIFIFYHNMRATLYYAIIGHFAAFMYVMRKSKSKKEMKC